MKIKNIMLCISIMTMSFLCETLLAQAVKIGGEIRTRTEMRDGVKSPVVDSMDAALVTNMRTRLNLSYTTNVLKAKITLQDTRTFGQTLPGTAATATTGIYEAWGEYLFAPGMSFSIGRQPLEYDDKRIFSASNWSNTGCAHDVLLLKYTSTDFSAHIGSAWNNSSDLYVESAYKIASYKTLNYIWLTKSIGGVGASAIWVNDGFQKDTKSSLMKNLSYRNTVGGNIWLNDPEIPISVYTTGYYQFGHDNSTSYKNLNAYMLAGKVKGQINKALTLSAGGDYYSGSGTTLDKNKNNTFTKLYGVNHFFNGTMEYWTTPPTQGLSDLYFGVEGKVLDNLKADATFHKFDLARKPKTGSKDLGTELDITLTYDLSPEVSIQGGYSTYFLTDAVKTAKKITINSDTPQWAFLMICFKPSFLTVK